MESSNLCSTQEFVDKSNAIINAPFQYGYSSISSIYAENAHLERLDQNDKLANALDIASRVCSMNLAPESLNEPFRPSIHNLQVVADDFSAEELAFIEGVHIDITDELVKARFADLLWLRINPKKIKYAQTAIQNYLSLAIDSENWNIDVGDCWKRCIQLAIQTRDKISIEKIETSLEEAFQKRYQNSSFMNLWIAEVIVNNKLLQNKHTSIAEDLLDYAVEFCSLGSNHIARDYLSLSERIFKAQGKEADRLRCLLLSAESFEKEGDLHSYGDNKSALIANANYGDALRAYRKIPNAKRDELGVTEKIDSIRKKITATGSNLTSEMISLTLGTLDISQVKADAIQHVKGKDSLEIALLCFTGLYSNKYQISRSHAVHILESSIFSGLFASSHISHDGRIIAKTAAFNSINDNVEREQEIYKKAILEFQNFLKVVVEGKIIPALNQILTDFTITKEYLEELCRLSPIVPIGREYLMSSALWSGFEYDFRNCIHLLAPQVEHLIRTKMKNSGVDTSSIVDGIENENGLSSLLKHKRAADVLGEDLLFELQALFTESMGANLRNEVAHGLLNDQNAESHAVVYAWWIILKLIVRSLNNS
jgi:hypothetical protein